MFLLWYWHSEEINKESSTVGCTKERDAAIFSNLIFVSFGKVTQLLNEPPHGVQGTRYPLGLLGEGGVHRAQRSDAIAGQSSAEPWRQPCWFSHPTH